KFSASQVKHHAQHGEGIVSDYAAKGYNMLKPHLRTGIRAGLDYGKNVIQNEVERALRLHEGQGVDHEWNQRLPRPRVRNGKVTHGDGVLSDTFRSFGLGAAPKPKKGGFIGKLLRKGAHGLVDFAADSMGGNVQPNPLANPNEQIAAALRQKKV